MTALAQFKRAVREAIRHCGGIDGAAATCGKQRSTAGNWNNRNMADLPTLGDAFALDEVAMIDGQRPEILRAFAAALGHVCIRLPEPAAGNERLIAALAEASAEFGDIAHAVCDATADGLVSEAEQARIQSEIDDAIERLAAMRALVAAPQIVPIRRDEG